MKHAFRAIGISCAMIVAGAPAGAAAPAAQAQGSPQAVVEELLAADRAFAAASSKTDLVTGISAMFADDVSMGMPPGKFSRNKAEAIEGLRANPANGGAKAEWTPIRGGISADGQHGFTAGYMTITADGKPPRHAKYVSYWVKKPEGWRVASYKRGARPDGSAPAKLLPPSLPPRLVAPKGDAAAIARYKSSLDQAERSFSDEAQKIGIGPAFKKYGRADAINQGQGSEFVVGAEAIGAGFGDEPTSPVTWAPDDVLVASSGDFGITWGFLRLNGPVPEGQPAQIPYTTVWRRDSVNDPWRYVAE